MGLMDKIKNLFTDEEIIEEEEPVKIKEIKKDETKEHKLPTFMREKIEKEEKEKKKEKTKQKEEKKKEEKKREKVKEKVEVEKEKKEEIESPILNEEFKPMDAEIEIEEKASTFKFPVFEESDFIEPTRASRHIPQIEEEPEPVISYNKIKEVEEPKPETKVAKLYKDKIEDEEEIKKFKASPIISPIFGVLDKNYIPSDVATRKGGNYEISRHSKNVDFDSVRKKAFESKKEEEEIKDNILCENCEYLKKAKSCEIEGKNKDIIEEEMCRRKREVKDITMDEAEENYYDYGVSYEKKHDIDPIYLDVEDDKEGNIVKKEEVKIVNHAEDEKEDNKEIPPVKSSINILSTIKKSMDGEEEPKEKDLELTDDLFNLIDSMYDEKEE